MEINSCRQMMYEGDVFLLGVLHVILEFIHRGNKKTNKGKVEKK